MLDGPGRWVVMGGTTFVEIGLRTIEIGLQRALLYRFVHGAVIVYLLSVLRIAIAYALQAKQSTTGSEDSGWRRFVGMRRAREVSTKPGV